MPQNMVLAVYSPTRHVLKRCQQRGAPMRDLQFLLDMGDHSVAIGRGCQSITLSRTGAVALRAEGTAVADLDRACRRAVVVDEIGRPVTLLHLIRGKGRRYRRGQTGQSWARR
jgi:hypothetical protein